MTTGGAAVIPPNQPRTPLPPAQAHRSAGKGMLIAIVVALVILFALVAWSRYHRSQQPPSAPMHQQTQVISRAKMRAA